MAQIDVLDHGPLGHDHEPTKRDKFHFRVSSGLKRLIGRDLIVNDFVAIFELVKNSFDAGAKRVDLIFDDGRLYIIDNGKGMSRPDISDKWLFVAYSAKRDGSEDASYRERIKSPKAYAGSKGVGRFSCDRLGKRLRLQSRTAARGAMVEVIEVDWDRFERNDKEEFARIPVLHSTVPEFFLPDGLKAPKHGTILEVQQLRQPWDRARLLALKAALAKLINPFGAAIDRFEVTIRAPNELEADKREAGGVSPLDGGKVPQNRYGRVVNGPVKNFIFDTLREKTTYIDVEIVDDGTTLESRLIDRGELIYHIREPNTYARLVDSRLKCQLFYLNQSAKKTFTQRMGVQSTQFGSVFLFRNGFRVYPIGEDGEDTFGLDRRKQQGHSRFLGTREVIGRIDVFGSEEDFKEATSRDQGLIRTAAYEEMEDCFREKCIKRLERYVVDISWKDPADKDFDDITRMLGDKASARITELVSRLAGADGVELLGYSQNLVRIVNEKSEDFGASLKALRIVAEHTTDRELIKRVQEAQARYKEIQQAEARARAEAERERQARADAESRAQEAARAQQRVEAAYEEEKKRSLFLASMASVDSETIVNLHHQIVIYAAEIHHNIMNQIDKIRHGDLMTPDQLLDVFERLAFKNQQILAVSRFATRANFRLDSEQIKADVAAFIVEYLEEVCPLFTADKVTLRITSSAKGLERRFKPIEVSMLLDNLISNAKKAGATAVDFVIAQPKAGEITMTVTDDGAGLDPSILESERIFEKGFTTTSGSGLGLYYVRYILDQMRGSIEADPTYEDGARFIVRIFK